MYYIHIHMCKVYICVLLIYWNLVCALCRILATNSRLCLSKIALLFKIEIKKCYNSLQLVGEKLLRNYM